MQTGRSDGKREKQRDNREHFLSNSNHLEDETSASPTSWAAFDFASLLIFRFSLAARNAGSLK
jgi:hypothetical protein